MKGESVKLSIVIICWNDSKVIDNCLRSIYEGTQRTDIEVIVSDNGSSDGSVEFIRAHFPKTRIVENRANLGFAMGNNAGIDVAAGEYVLILNPDTIVHKGSLDRWLDVADQHPEAGAFGCRVLNPDGSYQRSSRPFPTVRRLWMAALYLKGLAYVSDFFLGGEYVGWQGDSERIVDWQSGCCILVRGKVLKELSGFDPQFFYHYEEVDLCRRIWNSGHPILFTPAASITHLGGQSVNRFPIRFVLEAYRSRYRYFYKHFGKSGATASQRASIAWIRVRQLGYAFLYAFKRTDVLKRRLEMYRVALQWNRELDPVKFVEAGEEPQVNVATQAA